MRTSLLVPFLLTASLCFADRGADLLSAIRKDAWMDAYGLAKDVDRDASASNRDRGLAAIAAYRAGDLKLSKTLAASNGKPASGWQTLAEGLLLQFSNDNAGAEKAAKSALKDKEAANDAHSFLIGIYQTQAKFPEAMPHINALLEAKPTGYPFDELLPQLAGLKEVYPTLKKVPSIGAGIDATVPLKTTSPYIVAEFELNGKPGRRMILDTGGSICPSIGPSAADELDVKQLAKSAAFGFGGMEDIAIGRIETIKTGDISWGPMPVAIIGMLDQFKILNLHGVLDTRWLLDHAATFDLEGKQLLISSKFQTPKAGKQLGGDTVVALPFYLIADAKLVLPIKLDGQASYALFDTGSPINMLSFDDMKSRLSEEDYKIGRSMTSGVGTSAKAPQQIASKKPMTLTVGGHDIVLKRPIGQQSLDQQVSHGVGFRLGALLGLELMRGARNFTIDGPGRMLYITYKAPVAE